GRTLWWWRSPPLAYSHTDDVRLEVWQTHGGGEYRLAVSRSGFDRDRNPLPDGSATYLLSASTGELLHVLPEVTSVGLADFNGAGVPDLYYTHHPRQGGPEMTAVLGEPKRTAAWRWGQKNQLHLDPRHGLLVDLDGDGIADPVGDGVLALSGRDGRPLW